MRARALEMRESKTNEPKKKKIYIKMINGRNLQEKS